MKYEAVFGNQELFDGAGTFTGLDVVVHSIASGIKSCARLSDLTPESLRNHPVCAMRRIIKEPKRWTWEDKREGLLPEVGCDIQYIESQKRVSVIAINSIASVVATKLLIKCFSSSITRLILSAVLTLGIFITFKMSFASSVLISILIAVSR
jgi:hypothetical protein